jgi:NAD(P)-dependent dehydrogenase (short-subunit alcohol dehydrogenase family)
MSATNDILKEGNTAVITGASSGIGRAAALDFASRGMNIWMIDIDQEELDAAFELVKQNCSKSMTQQVRRHRFGFLTLCLWKISSVTSFLSKSLLEESTYLLYSFSLPSS